MDTDVIIELFGKKSELGKILMFRIMEIGEVYCKSAINAHELLYGIENTPRILT